LFIFFFLFDPIDPSTAKPESKRIEVEKFPGSEVNKLIGIDGNNTRIKEI
jgi:hypothetical protein